MATNLQFVRLTKGGEVRKLGFTSVGKGTDGLVKTNVEELSKAHATGKLTDREGLPIGPEGTAWVQGWILVSTTKAKQDLGVDDEFVGTKGTVAITVPAGQTGANPADASAPFGE